MTRIVIISNHLMFGHGLESLLRNQDGLDIVARKTTIAQAIDTIKELNPDVIILDNDDPSQNSTWDLMHILTVRPKIKVIRLSLQHNNLHIFQAKQWVAKDVEDLVEAVQDESGGL